MCDRHMDPSNWRQYHPVLQQRWSNQITAYILPSKPTSSVEVIRTNYQVPINWQFPIKS